MRPRRELTLLLGTAGLLVLASGALYASGGLVPRSGGDGTPAAAGGEPGATRLEVVIDRAGRAVARAVGPRAWDGDQARALFENLLAEPRAGL